MPHVRHVYVLQPLARPYVRHVCVLMPLVRPHVRHARLGLHIAVSLKGRTARIWSFGCGFVCTTEMGCAGSDYYLVQLLFYNYRLLLNKDQEIKVFTILLLYMFHPTSKCTLIGRKK